VTRTISGFPISHDPAITLLDSPGIMVPRFSRTAEGRITSLKLALTGAIKDTVASEEVIAEFLLSTLNGLGRQANDNDPGGLPAFYRRLGLEQAYTDIQPMLHDLAVRMGALRPVSGGIKSVDTQRAAQHFIRQYRDGEFGRFTLDAVPPPTQTNKKEPY